MRRSRQSTIDACLIGAAMIGLICVAWKLSEPSRVEVPLGEAQMRVAKLAQAIGLVKRRSPGSLVWESLHVGTPLLAGDTVFTPPHVHAMLEMNDGAQLEMVAETLFVLESSELEATHARLLEGQVIGETRTQELVIASRFGEARISAGAKADLRTGDDRLRAHVVEGSIQLGAITLDQDERGELAGEDARKRPSRGITLLNPPHLARLGAGPGVRLTLRWDKDVRAKLRLVPSGELHQVEGRSHSLAMERAGSYRWQLVDNEGRPLSEESVFLAVDCRQPKLLSPDHDASIVAPKGIVTLTWEPRPGETTYELELLREGNAQTLTTIELDASRWQSGVLEETLYRWRLRELRYGVRCPQLSSRTFSLYRSPLIEAPTTLGVEIK